MAQENKPEKIESEVKNETEKKVEKIKVEKIVKEFAVANGASLRISPKASYSICKVIRGKSPENAIKRLEEAISGKRAIPMADREVGHKKGKGMSGGRLPINACTEIIKLIKQVEANASINNVENPVIVIANANRASRPYKSEGRRAKRTHVHLEVRDKSKLAKLNK